MTERAHILILSIGSMAAASLATAATAIYVLRDAGFMVSGIALFAIAIGVGFIIRLTSLLIQRIERRTRELRDAHERLRSHSSQVSLEIERARRALAIDLHDGIGQLLALVNIKLGLLRSNPGVDAIEPGLQEIESLVAEAREQSREMTWQLCPPVLYEVGLMAAIRWLAKDMERRYGLRVRVEEEGECRGLDEATRIALFRSVNELLINVAKHSKTDKALVRVSNRDRDIVIAVEDQGVGFDSTSRTSEYGLFGVRERMHHLGGILRIASTRGEGTRVYMVAPVETAGSEAKQGSA
jgi:signal transduction histidine kinase